MEKEKKANVLKIYDPAMCCSSGVCGPKVNPALVEFAGALNTVMKRGILVERFGLSQQPQAFISNEKVKKLLEEKGEECLPLIFVDDELKYSGKYPSASELLNLLGIEADVSSTHTKVKRIFKCDCPGGSCK